MRKKPKRNTMTLEEWNRKYDPGQKVSVLIDSWPIDKPIIKQTETVAGAFLDELNRQVVVVRGLHEAVELWRVTADTSDLCPRLLFEAFKRGKGVRLNSQQVEHLCRDVYVDRMITSKAMEEAGDEDVWDIERVNSTKVKTWKRFVEEMKSEIADKQATE